MADFAFGREAKIGVIDAGVLALAAAALTLDLGPVVAVGLAMAHVVLCLMRTGDRAKWIGLSLVIWMAAAGALYGLWAVGLNGPASHSAGGVDWWTLASQAVLLPGIFTALIGAPGAKSLLAEYMSKFGELRP